MSSTGARPLFFPYQEGEPVDREALRIRQELYSFIESGIPVILCMSETNRNPEGLVVGGHAVVVVGHNLPALETVSSAGYVQLASKFMNVETLCPITELSQIF
jgi:hypothetical protein